MTTQIQQGRVEVIEEIAVENQSPCTGLGPDSAAPSIDEEEIVSEVAIRERLIEWLVEFLPGESCVNEETT